VLGDKTQACDSHLRFEAQMPRCQPGVAYGYTMCLGLHQLCGSMVTDVDCFVNVMFLGSTPMCDFFYIYTK
jgi:hypothetical protein